MKPSEMIALAMTEIADQKPADRSALDRSFAVLLTELEKAYAYAQAFVDKE